MSPETRHLGRSGVPVSALTLGTLGLGTPGLGTSRLGAPGLGTPGIGTPAPGAPGPGTASGQRPVGVEDGVALVHAALDAGITAIDVVDPTGAGVVEEIVGTAIDGRRDEVFLAASLHPVPGEDPRHGGNSRGRIVRAVETSLRRLGTDVIDLFQVHGPDPHTALDETLAALEELTRHGKIRYSGTSAFPGEELVEAQWIAGGPWGPSTERVPYSLLVRTAERTTFPVARRFGLGVLGAAPLAEGWLTGGYRAGAAQPTSRRAASAPSRFDVAARANRRKLEAADALGMLADDAGLTLIELAVAFALNHPDVSTVVVGPRTTSHLHAYLEGAAVSLPTEVLDAVDRIVPPGTHFLERDTGAVPEALTPTRLRRSVRTATA